MANPAPIEPQIHHQTTTNDEAQNNGNMDATTTTTTTISNLPIPDSSTDPVTNDEPPFEPDRSIDLNQLCQEVCQFATSISNNHDSKQLDIPNNVGLFLERIESKLEHYESAQSSTATFGHTPEDDCLFLKAIDGLAMLIEALNRFKSGSHSAAIVLNQASSHLHQAMLILEEELRVLLEKWRISPAGSDGNAKEQQENQPDHCVFPDHQQQSEQEEEEANASTFPAYSSEDISMMSSISAAMASAGYKGQCIRLFVMTRRTAIDEELTSQGFDKFSIDDVQKMQWETLEGEIATWIRVLKHCTSSIFPGELKFYQSIFDSASSLPLFSDLANSVIQQLVNLAHAVAMTKRSSEKLFKFLDMFETLRDLTTWIEESSVTKDHMEEMRSEIEMAGSRIGEVAVSIFCELEASIRNDNAKQPVASGAVHPLTRYTMNYLKYACEYKDSLEELFIRHLNKSSDDSKTPFTHQLMTVMDLLDANLETKSKLYRDPSLKNIFLMNNGRYMLQKIKGSPEMGQAVGDTWYRKRSSEMRSYHKSYQRDTWGRVLQCLNQEGLTVNGKIQKQVLKDRFKNFNQLFDEIHKTQSSWVISDEQLRSELRVSISAVMIPAYRAFLARFGQIFTPGRQYEKHIKYQPDDIETAIEELFDGNANSMARRRT